MAPAHFFFFFVRAGGLHCVTAKCLSPPAHFPCSFASLTRVLLLFSRSIQCCVRSCVHSRPLFCQPCLFMRPCPFIRPCAHSSFAPLYQAFIACPCQQLSHTQSLVHLRFTQSSSRLNLRHHAPPKIHRRANCWRKHQCHLLSAALPMSLLVRVEY